MLKWTLRVVLLLVVALTLPYWTVVVFGVWGMINPPEQPVIKTPDATIGILFNKFTGERSFAAFAVDADGHWGLTGRGHSAAAARAAALARCGDPKRPGLTASFQNLPWDADCDRSGRQGLGKTGGCQHLEQV